MLDETDDCIAQQARQTPFVPAGDPAWQHFDEFVAEAGAHNPGLTELVARPNMRELLAGVWYGSPYLSGLAMRDVPRLMACLTQSPEKLFEAWKRELRDALTAAETVNDGKAPLRRFKNSVALLTALGDIAGAFGVMTATSMLSRAADGAVDEALRLLFRLACRDGNWQADDPDTAYKTSGYFVLAMGKQGAFELNYSSDIDLIVFFNRRKATYCGNKDLQSFFVRLTRDLVQLLEERTSDGYVFRTDLRLRPDAGATQMALSTSAAFGYYETVGQNWERAAMIKARACAGDITEGEHFLAELSPFIWRKYMDFAQIADVHAMKRQIHAHKGIGEITVPGQNVKLGRGGIREIEFFVQTQQLIAGGRQPGLRVRPTLEALVALQEYGWVKPNVRVELEEAYLYLRRIEHRLQMVADVQTHDVPEDAEALERFAHFAGYETVDAFAADLRARLSIVEQHYAELFEDAPALAGQGGSMVFAGANDDPKTVDELSRLGFSQPSQVLAIVRGWHHGRKRAVRTARGRELLTEVQPLLISALADTVDPDAAIAEFDRFLSNLPSGVQLFSLLKANPALMRLIADIMGSTPRLARILSKRRRLLDAVLDPAMVGNEISASAIDRVMNAQFATAHEFGAADHMQDILDSARVVGSEFQFLIGIGILTGSISAAEAGEAYATVAERLVGGLLKEVTRQMELEYGRVPGGVASVIAMGKLGGREMTATSDIDLILLYDFAADASGSDGPKALAPSQYYTRLTQRLINAITAPTAQGTLYEVDLRLRPSGQKGPLATRFSSFVSYQSDEAWTWEHMALTRARVIAGDTAFCTKTTEAIRDVLLKPRDAQKIAADVTDMRRRIAQEKGSDQIWDLKQTRGGLVDLEFIVQYLQLVEGAAHPKIVNPSTLIALTEMGRAGVLSMADVATLSEAGGLLHDLMQILRLSLDGPFNPATAPAGLKALLARAGRCGTFDELEQRLRAATDAIAGQFDRIVGPVWNA